MRQIKTLYDIFKHEFFFILKNKCGIFYISKEHKAHVEYKGVKIHGKN